MQTFLPYGSDFGATARCLDRARLGKQRVEAFQILRTLNGETKGWRNHPAVLQWKGHESTLAIYGIAMCREWIRRGYTDNLERRFGIFRPRRPVREDNLWIDDPRVVRSHRVRLIQKDAAHYGPIWPDLTAESEYETCCPGCAYWWPSHAIATYIERQERTTQ